MKLFGFEVSVRKAAQVPPSVQGVYYSPWSYGPIRESFSGAWQQNVTIDSQPSLLANATIYACVTGIASDIAKNRIMLTEDRNGVWKEIKTQSPWLPVLRKPNHYQNRIEFIEAWIVSKLLAGNLYALKQRDDARKIVTALYPLNPTRVLPLVGEDGSVWYRLNTDYLSELPDEVTVPASEIIHDRMCCLWHPLVGVPPLYAAGIAATMGNKITNNSANMFTNSARPGGVLTAPGQITNETAARLKAAFETNFGGANYGRVAVLGDGLKFDAVSLTAEASQLIEQLKWTTEEIARPFHYPLWKLGGPVPPYSAGPQAVAMQYYQDCLQPLIEKLELCLDEGLELPSDRETELDLDNLLRMDTQALYDSNNKGVSGGWMTPDEARYRANFEPVEGGDTPYLQQQNYSLAALSKRDESVDPFGKATTPQTVTPTPPAAPPAATPAEDGADVAPTKALDQDDWEAIYAVALRKEYALHG